MSTPTTFATTLRNAGLNIDRHQAPFHLFTPTGLHNATIEGTLDQALDYASLIFTLGTVNRVDLFDNDYELVYSFEN